ncbi:hypothetical protein [Gilvimarinus xylanilyticus]|uniref:Uncharacterized protein n=1 Tax=Gilvimarinus xylanilyticus TaxID=2944139 RepID=A0A9X2HW53_9GAMM|nr:hypothetical protein [Gilvimarinus xylanilyticus]MCP8898774.1 hypothetical protein [Gilvimarinus xylanilyticus]
MSNYPFTDTEALQLVQALQAIPADSELGIFNSALSYERQTLLDNPHILENLYSDRNPDEVKAISARVLQIMSVGQSLVEARYPGMDLKSVVASEYRDRMLAPQVYMLFFVWPGQDRAGFMMANPYEILDHRTVDPLTGRGHLAAFYKAVGRRDINFVYHHIANGSLKAWPVLGLSSCGQRLLYRDAIIRADDGFLWQFRHSGY